MSSLLCRTPTGSIPNGLGHIWGIGRLSTPLKVLVIEERQPVAERVARALRRGGFRLVWKRIETAEELRASLKDDVWNVVLFGRDPPRFDALEALEIVREKGGVPLFVVADALPVHRVVELIKAGVTDVVDTEDLSRLVPAMRRALDEASRNPSDGQSGAAKDVHRALVAAILDTAEALIVVLDGEGRIREFNRACQQTTGFGFDEVVGRPIWECLIPEAEVEVARDVFHAKIRSGAIKQFESDWLAKDGTIRTVRWSNSSIREDGGISYNLGIGIDVTEQRRAERALHESQEKLRAVADNLPAAIYFKHTDGRFVVANRRYEQWYGVSGGATGKTVYDIFPKAEADVYAAQDREVLDTAKEIERETHMRLPNGDVHCFLVTKFPIFGADGNLDGIGGINIDISERKKAEDALRESEARILAITDSFSSQISYVDKDQRYRFNNRAYEEWFGISREDCYGKHVKHVLGEENYQKARGPIERALSGERVHYEYLSRYRNRERHADVTYIPDIAEDGSVKGVYALVNDITERKRIEQSLRTLHNISASQDLSFNEKLVALLKAGCKLLNLPFGIIARIEGERYEVVEASTPDASINSGDTFELGKTYCRETVKTRDVIGFEHATGSEWQNHPCYRERKVEAYLGAAVIVGTTVYGALSFFGFKPREARFTATDREILRLMAQWIGGDIARKQTEEALRDREKTIRAITDALPSQISYVDSNQVYRFNNKAYEDWYGISAEDCYGKHVKEILGENYDRAKPHIERALNGEKVRFEYVGRYLDGERYAEVSYIPDFAEDGEVQGFYGLVHDITERKQAEESLRKLSQAVQQSPASVLITDTKGEIEYVNPKFVELTGYAADEVIGKNPRLLKSGFVSEECYRDLWETITSGREWRGELLNRKKDGEVFWEFASISPIKTADGEVTHYVAVKEDITVRKEYEERLLHQASFDGLTGLPNRLLTLDRVDQAIARAKRDKQCVALAFIDLDNFKAINDTLGHSAGDALLVEAAHRLTASVRAGDTVGRLGGDEFVVVLPDLSEGSQSQVVADKILAAFRRPFSLEGRKVSTTVSIGVSVFPSDGDSSHTLLRNADAAMYQSKAAGRNTFRFFAPQIDQHAVKRTDIEFRLRHALERKEMFLVYHPLFDLRSGKLVGAEALLRWNHPELGLVSPDYFIPVAENDGLIGRLGEFVLRTACRQSRTWRQWAGAPMRVAVNVSSRQFQGEKLVETVSDALRDNQLTPEQLELEITEGVLVDDAPRTIGTLEALSEMGIHFSVDDFGTGYSSIGYLKRFPINTLKIDRSFVRDITTNPADAALAIAMIGMAHSLRMEVVAEGVETEEQLTFLRFHGCDLAQGYYFTRPMVSEEFAKYIHDRSGAREPALRPSALPR